MSRLDAQMDFLGAFFHEKKRKEARDFEPAWTVFMAMMVLICLSIFLPLPLLLSEAIIMVAIVILLSIK